MMTKVDPVRGWALDRIVDLDRHFPGVAGSFLRASAERRQIVASLLAAERSGVSTAPVREMADDERAHLIRNADHRTILVAGYGSPPAGMRGALRRAGTGTKRSARVMGTNTTATVRQLATSVGAMNGKIGEVLRDPTGMRRYGPLPTGDVPEPDKPGVDWEVLNRADYAALWRSVQTTDPRPVDRVLEELQRLQDAERMLDPVEYYLRHHFRAENVVQTRTLRSTSAIAAADLHRDFSEMMRDHFAGHRPINVQSFGCKVTAYLSEAWCPFSRKEEAKDANFYHVRERLDAVRDDRLADVVAISDAPRRAA